MKTTRCWSQVTTKARCCSGIYAGCRLVLPLSPAIQGTGGHSAFSPDGQTLVLDIDEGSLLLWDVRGRQRPYLPPRPSGCRDSAHVQPEWQGPRLRRHWGTLLLWDLSARQPRFRLFSGYREPVRAFTFSPDSKMLASGDQEGMLLLLDLSVTPPMSILLSHDQRYARPLTFSPDGKTLATGGNGGPRLWNLDFDSWPNQACRIANRNLTCAEWTQFIKDEEYRPTCKNLPLDQCEARLTSKVGLE